MINGMSSRTRKIVSGLAALGTTALLLPVVVDSFDTRLQAGTSASEPASAAVAWSRRSVVYRKV